MQPFELSRTESLLLGLTLGQYSCCKYARFKECLDETLGPFAPAFRPSARRHAINVLQVPEDIVWGDPVATGEQTIHIGYAPSAPSSFFSQEGDEYYRIDWDHSRKSLTDLVLLFLGDAISLSRWERAFLPGDSPVDIVRQLRELQSNCDAPDLLQPNHAIEDREQVERRLLEVIHFNQHEPVFRLGQLLGAAQRVAKKYEIELAEGTWSYEPSVEPPGMNVDIFVDEILPLLREILKSPELAPCSYATDILKSALTFLESPEPAGDGITPDEFIEFARKTSRALNLAIGDILGTFRSADLAAGMTTSQLPSLRHFQLRGDSSEDMVRATVAIAERDLTRPNQFTPEFVVRAISPGIEALVKRHWESELSRNQSAYRGKLGGFLAEKQRNTSGLEERFANIALTLYKTYRRPSEHDLDGFRCSWNEVRFVVSGMRVLLDLYEQLKRDK